MQGKVTEQKIGSAKTVTGKPLGNLSMKMKKVRKGRPVTTQSKGTSGRFILPRTNGR